MKESVLKNFLVNIRAFFTVNIRRSINENAKTKDLLNDKILCWDVLNYFTFHQEEALAYKAELEFLSRYGSYCVFPYEPATGLNEVGCGLDQETKMPFVVHNNHRLFFPSSFSLNDAVNMYRNYILEEKLLGENDCEGTPHQYQSPRLKVEEDVVLFDIGAAEGLFALDNIEKVSKAILVEGDPQWIGALQKTFAPYSEKVKIFAKYVTDNDSDTEISLTKVLSEAENTSSFVKMDIEGCELSVINGAREVLKRTKNRITFAVASYHRQNDYDEMKKLFIQMGYETECSNGYMLFPYYDKPIPPFFRKGIIRAKKEV